MTIGVFLTLAIALLITNGAISKKAEHIKKISANRRKGSL
jgi:hypothetical protein